MGDDAEEACSVSDLSREELEAAYFEMVRYAQQLQGRETQMTSAFRTLRQKYTALKADMSELLWDKLRRPECILDQMPPLCGNAASASRRGPRPRPPPPPPGSIQRCAARVGRTTSSRASSASGATSWARRWAWGRRRSSASAATRRRGRR